jgi:hypothetical protein
MRLANQLSVVRVTLCPLPHFSNSTMQQAGDKKRPLSPPDVVVIDSPLSHNNPGPGIKRTKLSVDESNLKKSTSNPSIPTLKVIPPKQTAPAAAAKKETPVRITLTLKKPTEKAEEPVSKKLDATLEILDKMKFAPGQRDLIIKMITDGQKDDKASKLPIVVNDARLISPRKESGDFFGF